MSELTEQIPTKMVIVTGSTGWIGQYCVNILKKSGFEVWEYCTDLLTQIPVFPPSTPYLLHLAWNVKPGYWKNPENIEWFKATARLIERFCSNGGKRVVVAGTQTDVGQTLYGRSKAAVRDLLKSYNVTGLSSVYGRIHCLYGLGESPDRLIPSVINHALKGENIPINHPYQMLDYLYVEDVAYALCALLDNDVTGSVDIGSGKGITTLRIAQKIAEKIGVGWETIISSNIPSPEYLIADCKKTNDIWDPMWTLDKGLDVSIKWWKTTLKETTP